MGTNEAITMTKRRIAIGNYITASDITASVVVVATVTTGSLALSALSPLRMSSFISLASPSLPLQVFEVQGVEVVHSE